MGTAARKTDGRRGGEGDWGEGGLQGVAEGKGCVDGGWWVIKKGEMRIGVGRKRGETEVRERQKGEKGALPSSPSPPRSLSATSSPLHLSLSNELLALSDSGREAPSLHQTGALTG